MTRVPVLLVTGFLGAGKTSFINRILVEAQGLRIAAIVNDFGAINIDAELIAGAKEGVIGLANGCICCSLQGDLLRTLRRVLMREERPDAIVIEASGVADPRGIIEALSDPLLWNVIQLDAVICVVDGADCSDTPARLLDPLWLVQLQLADFVVLAKAGGMKRRALSELRLSLAGPAGKPVFDLADGLPPMNVLFPEEPRERGERPPGLARTLDASRFTTLDWTAAGPVSQAAFGEVLNRISPGLVRAKGFLRFDDRPDRAFLLQLVGRRATLVPAEAASDGCRLVMIGETGRFDPDAARPQLDALCAAEAGPGIPLCR